MWCRSEPNGLPQGVDYDLQVSLDRHQTAGFVFSPSPVLESESSNNTLATPQSIEDFNNFFNFFDPNIVRAHPTNGSHFLPLVNLG